MASEYIILKRNEFYKEVWSTPMAQLALKYGVSDVWLAKLCKRMEIPRPGRGYWARAQNGWKVKQLPLGPLSKHGESEATMQIREPAPAKSTDLKTLEACEKVDKNKIIVSERLAKPHPLIAATREILSQANVDDYGCFNIRMYGGINVRASKANMPRALRIMDALFKGLEQRGNEIVVSKEHKRETYAIVQDEEIKIQLEEVVKKGGHIPTKEELLRQTGYSWRIRSKDDYVPTNHFSLRITSRPSFYIARHTWRDSKKCRLEDCLNEFVLALYESAEFLKKERIQEQLEEERRAREEEIRRQRRLLKEAEENKVKRLNRELEGWRKGQEIRAYLDAVKKSCVSQPADRELSEWLKWAEKYADHIDPLKDFRIAILDEG